MKQTKRLMVTLLALLLVATFALCACTPKCDHVFEDGVCTLCGETEYVNVTIVLANGHDDANKQVYNVNTADYNVGTSKSVCDLLVAISESEGEKQLFTCVTEGTALKQPWQFGGRHCHLESLHCRIYNCRCRQRSFGMGQHVHST